MDFISTATAVFNLIKTGDVEETAKSYISTLSKDIPISTQGGLTRFLKPFTVEPLIVITDDVFNLTEHRDNILNACIDLFSSYYLQVFNVLTRLYNVNPIITYDILSTTKVAYENFTFIDNEKLNFFKSTQVQDKGLRLIDKKYSNKSSMRYNTSTNIKNTGATMVKDHPLNKIFYRIIETSFKVYGSTKSPDQFKDTEVTLPIAIKPNIVPTDAKNLNDLYASNEKTNTFWYRVNQLLVGDISWYNFVMADDLVRSYKEKRFNDLKSRNIKGVSNEFDLDQLSKFKRYKKEAFSTTYQMLILTYDELERVSRDYMVDVISNEKERNDFMKHAKLMTIFAVDLDNQSGIIFMNDYKEGIIVSLKSLAKKKDGADLSNMITNLLVGKSPFF